MKLLFKLLLISLFPAAALAAVIAFEMTDAEDHKHFLQFFHFENKKKDVKPVRAPDAGNVPKTNVVLRHPDHTPRTPMKRYSRTANLKKIGVACRMYVDDYHSYPPDFTALVNDSYVYDLNIFVSPLDADQAIKRKKLSQSKMVSRENTSFVYLGKGLTEAMAKDIKKLPLAFEAPWMAKLYVSNDDICVLYTDFSVEILSKGERCFTKVSVGVTDGNSIIKDEFFQHSQTGLGGEPIRGKNCEEITKMLLKYTSSSWRSSDYGKAKKIVLVNAVDADQNQ